MSHADWIMQFPGLSRLSTELRQYLTDNSRVIDIPVDTVIFGPGKPPEQLLLLLSGTVRVQKTSETGREIVLYRVHAGESCVLTTACLMAYEDYSAEGIAETGLQAVAIPRDVFDRMVADSPEFRQFVFMAYSRRMTDLFAVVEEIAFRRLDIRLAQKLIELSSEQQTIQTTHQKLAGELGTAREVISRQLAEFQRRGWIEQARGVIHILDRDQIKALAKQ
ncbi:MULTISPECIES: Crp/Fnr family transcriptional regulator [unclassified Thalassospira]|jgi:CRP/FNR family transcriptional regulator|uniref:Crp/Fnr family transcriptional regulator n=1 Tax=Thalassospira TaxID=168934 RepID=UPI001B0844A6|nr:MULTISPECIES: Crp/Fnr family transcriptional regulator [unclassified Thalassospira]MBO6772174.1 Crp/Fnr family transcriptional regulator [Thalassospira sp.]MEE3043782.1 Crp/Fnr family transcriptional regulator [Pseudomonadota bacterium]URK18239.1 Crp/Fnr family transcriptional regulator [Thalassospira sp. GO-4]